jgi:hypothetical protein
MSAMQQRTDGIIYPDQFDINKFEVEPPSIDARGRRKARFKYDGQYGLAVQTYEQRCPFGISEYVPKGAHPNNNPGATRTHSLDLSLDEFNEPDTKSGGYYLYRMVTQIEAKIKRTCQKNASEWFSGVDEIDDKMWKLMFCSAMRNATEPRKEEYPPTLRIKAYATVTDDGKALSFRTLCKDRDGITYHDLRDVLKPQCRAVSIISTDGIWFLNNQLGASWTARQVLASKPFSMSEDFVIAPTPMDTEEDEYSRHYENHQDNFSIAQPSHS